jgi:hypothetical protein
MYHKGKFTDINHPEKYVGDIRNITYRSHWERNVMRWLDGDKKVLEWASEEISIHYQHPIYNRRAKYYPDFYIKFTDGTVKVIEVKPKIQCEKPMKPKGAKIPKRYINEMMSWAINCEKWDSALKLAERTNIIFEIWTEDTLKAMGILNWETNKSVLMSERTASTKPKLKNIYKAKKKTTAAKKTLLVKKQTFRPRPNRKS